MSSFNRFLIAALIFGIPILVSAKPVELVFWHAMAGSLGDEVAQLASEFNQSQQEYVIKPVYKGNYLETLTSFAAAFRAHQPPSIVQIFEAGTAIMSKPEGVIKPVEEIMHAQNIPLPKEDFIPAVREFYSHKGMLLALPFNLSLPVLYYNADALEKLGYNETNFPKTWQDMEQLAEKVKETKQECVYTTAYPGWILLESFLAIHHLPFNSENNLASIQHLTHHFERLKAWHRQRYFRYAGRVDDATILFTGGRCLLLSQSSGAYNSLAQWVPFRLGVASMPLDTGISKNRGANVVGGAALWAVAGKTTEHYKGIARFFEFLMQEKIQQRWHESTGYLPLGLKGRYASIAQTSQHPSLKLARLELMQGYKAPGHLIPQHQIRQINEEILEALFAGTINSRQAVARAIARKDFVLSRFNRNTKIPVNHLNTKN